MYSQMCSRGRKGEVGQGAQTHKTRPSAHMPPRRLGIQSDNFRSLSLWKRRLFPSRSS